MGKLPGEEGRGSSGVSVRKGFLTTLALSSNGCFSKYLAPKRVKCAGRCYPKLCVRESGLEAGVEGKRF